MSRGVSIGLGSGMGAIVIACLATVIWWLASDDGSRAAPLTPETEVEEPDDGDAHAQLVAAPEIDSPLPQAPPTTAAPAEAPDERLPVPVATPTPHAPTEAEPPSAPPDAIVQGRIRSQSGAWGELERLLAGHVRLELHAPPRQGGAPTAAPLVASLSRVEDPGGESWIGFAFPPTVPGAYTLTVSTTDALPISPPRLDLRAPCVPLELWLLDDVETMEIGFHVLDAETLEPIEDFTVWSVKTEVSPEAGVLFHAGPLDTAAVALNAPLSWRLWADGYLPATGDERAFDREEDGRWVAEVHLHRGWGRRFVVLARLPTMQPVRGAAVELDGVGVGTTDADGVLDVALDAPPERFLATFGTLRAEGPVESDLAAGRRARISVIVLDEQEDD